MDPQLIGTLFSGALGGAVSSKALSGPLKTLDDWWFVTFGYKQSEKADMLRAKQSINLQIYNDLIIDKVKPIPQKNIQEPKLSILGPALEASRFYIEEQELREMFAKLISSSMDNRKNHVVHSSFVEIIKQMSSFDAFLLKDFTYGNPRSSGQITARKKNTEYQSQGLINVAPEYFVMEEVFYTSERCPDHNANEIALSSLSRLGLIVVLNRTFSDKSSYNDLQKSFDEYIAIPNHASFLKADEEHKLSFKMVSLTPYGQAFIDSCVNNF